MRLALALLVAMPFTLAPIRAADPEETTEQKVKRLERELTQLRKELDELRDDVRSNSLRRNVGSEELRKRLAILEQMVVRHDDLIKTPITRESGFGPGPQPAVLGNGGQVNASTARVTLRNQYPATTVTVRLNGRSYTIEPNRTLTVGDVPVGPLTYEVYVEGYQLQPTTVTLSPRGRIINVYPLEP